MIEFEGLELIEAIEEVREELNPLYIKHAYLHEMIREFYNGKDIESETAMYLTRKINDLNVRIETLQKVRDYLTNLERGVPFHVNRQVGRYMARYGLTEDQTKLLLDVYETHKKSTGAEKGNKYLWEDVQEVAWDEVDNCLCVHFGDTKWRYGQDGSWWQE